MKEVEIYTDGACSGNPGPGGWAAVLKYGKKTLEISGFYPQTTNNLMEMRAVIEALSSLKEKCSIKLYTDSKYIVDSVTKWIHAWINNGWISASKRPVKNRKEWEELVEVMKDHNIEWIWVKGHEGNLLNERCDHLARKQIEENKLINSGRPNV